MADPPVYDQRTFLFGLAVASWNPEERMQEGDIIAILPEHQVLGQKEKNLWMWVNFTNVPWNQELTIPMFTDDDDEEVAIGVNTIYKRRYRISFDDLNSIKPFDIAAVRDINVQHQPFIQSDEDDGTFLFTYPAIDVSGLIWDKKFTRYL